MKKKNNVLLFLLSNKSINIDKKRYIFKKKKVRNNEKNQFKT